jgi:hypothetical protein
MTFYRMKFIAKNLLSGFWLLCLASVLAGGQAATAQPAAAGVDLFNGKDFTGWTFYMRSNSAPEKTWSITNGVIHCTGRPAGFLRTEKAYADYKLTVEWRFVKVAPHADNTGVLVHMQPQEKIWPPCVECQGQYQKQGDFWLHSGTTTAGFPGDGKKSTHVPMAGPPNESPVGEWGTYQVIASGDTVEIIVNGKSMNKITGCNLSSGGIGIQSEGGDIEVRKIFLEPLK